MKFYLEKMNFPFIRQIFFAFSLIMLLFSCQKEPISADIAVNNEKIYCKIITSSSENPIKLLDSTLWQSSSIGKDDLIIFTFYQPVYIDKISIQQPSKQISEVKIYSNFGYLGDFSTDEVKIEKTISFIILKVQKTNNFHLTDAYKGNEKFQIAFQDLNNPVEIQSIGFWANDSTLIPLVIPKTTKNDFTYDSDLLNKKIIDYSATEKSFVLKSSGKIIGSIDDTIFYGAWNKSVETSRGVSILDLSIKKFVFSAEDYKTEKIKSTLSLKNNFIDIDGFQKFMFDFEDDYFVDIKTLDSTIIHDIRYATDNNFMHHVIYDCPYCLLRYGAGKALVSAQKEFQKMGYGIKVFDCYRPHSAQYKLWEIVPNINFVANPDKGSIHNRGAAVDLTLVDSLGNELDMGTEFDYFGYKAFSINLDLPDTILKNRNLLWKVMRKNGFMTIKTEWWHMSHNTCLKYPISETEFPCDDN